MIQPQQKLPTSKKTQTWIEDNIDFFIEQANFGMGTGEEMYSLYQAAEGILDESAYRYVLNPYNSEDANIRKYPARIRNYSIITPVINLYMGEKGKLPDNHTVIAINADSENKMTEELNNKMYDLLSQAAINTLNDNGIDTGLPNQPVADVAQEAKKFKVSWTDNRAIFGQEAVDYIKYNLDLKDKFQDAYYDWIVTGKVFTYKDVYRNDLHSEICNPMDFWYSSNEYSNFVEDGDAAVYRRRLSPNQIIDRFRSDNYGDGLSSENITWLEEQGRNNLNAGGFSSNTIRMLPSERIEGYARPDLSVALNGLIEVFHCVWKSYRKVGILIYQDELGQLQKKEVDETYKLDVTVGDLSIKWEYINQIWENYRIGDKGNCIYVKGRPLPVQRDELNNSSKNKLPYNGRENKTRTGNIVSLIRYGLNYQVLFNIYHYRMEMVMAKNKDKIMMMPLGLLPKGWDEDKYMYFLEATSIGWFDETKPNAVAVLQSLKSIDLGLGNYIEKIREFIMGIKDEWWDAVGMNRQRYGDTMSSDGKGVNEQAIFRSAIMTAELNRKFMKFEESDLQGLLDYSKAAWIDGKKGSYITSDGRRAFLNINGTEHLESNYGVFCKNGEEENEKLNMLRQYAFGLGQKGTVQSNTIAEIIDANNFSRIKQILAEVDAIEREYAAKVESDKNETAKYISDQDAATADQTSADKRYIADKKYQGDIETALIDAENSIDVQQISQQSNELIDNSNDDVSKDKDRQLKRDIENQKHNINQRKLSLQKEKQDKDNHYKEQDLEIKNKKLVIDRKKANKPSSK